MIRYIVLGTVFILLIVLIYPNYSILKIKFTTSQKFTMPQPSWTKEEQYLFNHVKYLSETIGSRSFSEPAKIALARDYIADVLRLHGLKPVLQDFTLENTTFSNIIITIDGQIVPEEIIVIGAHYDTVLGTPGADDNASATAMLLEITRIMADSKPDRTLKLVFFVLEEPPVFGTKNMGSRIFARRAREKNMDIRAMISLEMVGYFNDRKGKQGFPLPLMSLFYSNTPDFIGVVGNLKSKALVKQVKKGLKAGCSVPVETLIAPSVVPGISLSDHASFWKEGYPAVMITDSAFYRNPNYHRSTDTKDTLNYQTMAELLKGVIHVARDLSSAPHQNYYRDLK
jgi:Zn-dependent M28 family amino/carboxypeptidase